MTYVSLDRRRERVRRESANALIAIVYNVNMKSRSDVLVSCARNSL
jgi:hypothetical protein